MSTKKPYKPTVIPIKKLDWESLIPRIGMAQAAVARFADKKHLSAGCGSQQGLRARHGAQTDFLRHMWRTTAREGARDQTDRSDPSDLKKRRTP